MIKYFILHFPFSRYIVQSRIQNVNKMYDGTMIAFVIKENSFGKLMADRCGDGQVMLNNEINGKHGKGSQVLF